MSRFTRGFTGRSRASDAQLPPGQYDTGTVVAGADGRGHPAHRHRDVDVHASTGLVEQPTTWTWDEIHALPPDDYDGAIHCVTTWSKFDMHLSGRLASTRCSRSPGRCRPRRTCSRSRTPATPRTCRSTTSPAARRGSPARSTAQPLPRDHGGPARLLVPHLYFWKSAKWVAGITRARPRRARLLGGPRLPRPWRPVARAALPGRLIDERSSPSRPAGRRVAGRDRHRGAPTRRRGSKTFRSRLGRPTPHLAGQHFVVRLTAPDGYTRATLVLGRVAAGDGRRIELTVERLDDGEVSTFLHDERRRRRHARGARADRRLVRVGRHHAGPPDRRRLRRRAADGDAAPRAAATGQSLGHLVVSLAIAARSHLRQRDGRSTTRR